MLPCKLHPERLLMARRSWSRVTRRRCWPEEADRPAVGREPEVEGRAPPALQLQARPIRVAEILDQDSLGMAAGESQEVARWAERRRADQAEDAVAADEIAVGHRPEL